MLKRIFEKYDDDTTERILSLIVTSLMVIFLITVGMFFTSCGAAQPFITEDRGIVVDVGEQWVEVSYKVVNRAADTRVKNIYYKECGHYYSISDKYPDTLKERHPCEDTTPPISPRSNVKM